jgi:hypothetical protein
VCGMSMRYEWARGGTGAQRVERLSLLNSSHPVIESSLGLALAYYDRKNQLLVDPCAFSYRRRNTA